MEKKIGNLSIRQFLRKHWQKQPLLLRGALPGFRGVTDFRALRALAKRDDVESRIVERRGSRWETAHGPFKNAALRKTNATLLVSGVNLHVAAADELLRRFDFIPQARLDDVMVSYATPGGGVGPHVDSYDVFLLQGPGKRKWTVGKRSWIVAAGDLLYLPPGLRHHGVAIDSCYTYSIGFRAPRGVELGAAFLDWLHQRGLPDADFRDPGLAPASRPGEIPRQMLQFSEKLLGRIRWSRADVIRFMGEYLSEPKAHVVFRPRPVRRALGRSVVRLDAKTRLLYSGARFFMNGESVAVSGKALRALADQRAAPGALLARAGLAGLISQWQRAGYVHFEDN